MEAAELVASTEKQQHHDAPAVRAPQSVGMSEDHARRRKGLATSTVVPEALGFGYNTPYQAWLQVTGQMHDAPTGPQLERGTGLQQALLDWSGRKLKLSWESPPFVAHENGWTGDSADALYSDPQTGEVLAIGEAKTVAQGAIGDWGIPGTDEVPTYALLQAHWHLIHCAPSIDVCYVPVLFGGYRFEFQMYRVKRDNAFEADLMAKMHAWWQQHVVGGVPPPLIAGDTDYLNKRYPEAEENSAADVTDELIEAVAVRLKYEPVAKRADALVKAANNRIRACMGTAHRAKHDNFSVTWSNVEGSETVDWQAVARELAESAGIVPDQIDALAHKHTHLAQGYRKLTVTGRGSWKKEKK